MKTIKYMIKADTTIKEFLISNVSRKFQRHLKKMDVKYYINGEEAKSHFEIKRGDILEVVYKPDKIDDSHLYDIPLDIVYECKEYMIINKPRGLKTIPTGYNDFKSLYNAIISYYEKNHMDNTIHFINRLDKDTEGLLIVAKDKYSASILSKNLDNISRCYLAVACGIIESSGTIEVPISRGDGILRRVDPNGKSAITKYKVLKYIDGNTLLHLELLSGRCHQIRVHLESIGHPILGDPLYGEGDALHLTSYLIDFHDPFNDKDIHFEIKPWFGV